MIYLDNASTSFPKPPEVIEAVARCLAEVSGSAGRGAHAGARRAAKIIDSCRDAVAELLDAERAESIVFTHNATDALNLAIRGVIEPLLRRGESVHVVASAFDHNSVLRPIECVRSLGASVTIVDAGEGGIVAPSAVCHAIRGDTRLVVLNHASNVTGMVQRAAEIADACKSRGVPLLLDATQTLGHMAVSVRQLGVDLLAFSGHKGLLGPTGTGGLYFRPGFEDRVEPLRTGGTGTESESRTQPRAMPERFESGTINVAGLAGLDAGVRWVLREGAGGGFSRERRATAAFIARLRELGLDDSGRGEERSAAQELSVIGGLSPATLRVGTFAFVHDSVDVHQTAAMLESEHGVVTRAGLHCAPLAAGGRSTLRASFGPMVGVDDAVIAAGAIVEVFGAMA
ncbi:MAG: aminotransferase class V-fold PLP-dependent enzyme [Phycisphaerales bacterium]|jgi:cysteine desulfurase/selenocysteine lyase|nr:aminotransferase class V-fold PLP-dependent enzyme [Phycisphaerales bacterium]